jgi:hypothetical protein
VSATGARLVQLGRRHIGERYVLGALAPKSNPRAVVSFQASRRLVIDGEVGPATARALEVKLPPA